LFLLVLLCTGSVTFGLAGSDAWTSIGPAGGSVPALAVDPSNPDVVYAGTNGGIFKSTSGGTSWAPINNGIEVSASMFATKALAIDQTNTSIVYAAVVNIIFKSVNGGKSWSRVRVCNGGSQ
jgi:photosystem II stability/assembly factor-like uncharacterized protein